ncbi:bifunctional glutamate N-acetyltransferase/amino-acid acetyltransferase ArgJ [Kaistia dalseonensis]|uniref:Arginine biosynthesis bifunctional protein ArgJ n=1 Tax=Kaistia dalseonensis TaxID=410840 RepID=A0ABU0H3K1_9HYPH|nr:bifunctional glutamate N-acetyltransferase/amino-acid acetyltransferase ArgJ [Kaistia dalseonensis]MCX5494297.1 bifunctional glutamate N-acetyltransferase/amino-acid acetyltransferase ArgJ [Kaistia dalseonensis]MDQ0436878.1 glutamate N-acetyltransferase/amino-acid N-acetyltransferase [Kaistia dalseonensis]
MSSAISPLSVPFPDMPPIAGVTFATAEAGIKYKNRLDVFLALFAEGTTVAGVFTTSKCPSAPVDWCRQSLKGGSARALLVNSGNANAFTGKKGVATTTAQGQLAAEAAGCRPDEVFLASTGVIGEPLDASKFAAVLPDAARRAADGPWIDAARAIMTTDTFPKGATRSVKIGDATVTINGIAKGAGMIAPDMATMLSFVATDAAIAAPVLQALLSAGVVGSFNAVTVDSDTSTSDTLLLFATGKAPGAELVTDVADPRLAGFKAALDEVLLDLAIQVARDGEGARKLIEVRVINAASDQSAKRVAFSIANSPLVKTAAAGEDANWGRVVMAVGKAGEPADRDLLSISFGETRVAFEGERDPDYSEDVASAYMKNKEIVITADLGLGDGRATVWTCDLTKEYVAINGDYRS